MQENFVILCPAFTGSLHIFRSWKLSCSFNFLVPRVSAFRACPRQIQMLQAAKIWDNMFPLLLNESLGNSAPDTAHLFSLATWASQLLRGVSKASHICMDTYELAISYREGAVSVVSSRVIGIHGMCHRVEHNYCPNSNNHALRSALAYWNYTHVVRILLSCSEMVRTLFFGCVLAGKVQARATSLL